MKTIAVVVAQMNESKFFLLLFRKRGSKPKSIKISNNWLYQLFSRVFFKSLSLPCVVFRKRLSKLERLD